MVTVFEDAVEEHRGRIFNFACYLLSNRQEAEDVTQEVLLKLWNHRKALDEARLGAWLLRVTRNACYDLLRYRRARGGAAEASLDDEIAATLADDGPDPESVARGADFRRRLCAALRLLPEPYRSVVILREVEGLKYSEIGEALEMPLNTVRVNLHRGRRKLRIALANPQYQRRPTAPRDERIVDAKSS